eukprot:scaffold18489_cov32-Tisochrysis_lutea.AAC.2
MEAGKLWPSRYDKLGGETRLFDLHDTAQALESRGYDRVKGEDAHQLLDVSRMLSSYILLRPYTATDGLHDRSEIEHSTCHAAIYLCS